MARCCSVSPPRPKVPARSVRYIQIRFSILTALDLLGRAAVIQPRTPPMTRTKAIIARTLRARRRRVRRVCEVGGAISVMGPLQQIAPRQDSGRPWRRRRPGFRLDREGGAPSD